MVPGWSRRPPEGSPWLARRMACMAARSMLMGWAGPAAVRFP
ncbi:hypothetical protein ACFFX0_23645 [Citricoccus parietis]|uniref:Uncharacterized protein n=1 Tax=Citricoccus parietis TaxID=592307 RepID=A0ABV5G508_9MICC